MASEHRGWRATHERCSRRSLSLRVDEANLVLDHAGQVNVFLVAGLLSKGGFVGRDGVPDMDALRGVVGERIAALPQLRQVAAIAGRRHRWVAAWPDLDHHIRLIGAVEGMTGLESLCGDLMSVPLSPDRPMWELLVVPGATDEGVGVVLRIHHAIADGMAAVAIVKQLFDGERRCGACRRGGWGGRAAKPQDEGVRQRAGGLGRSPIEGCGASSRGSASACTASG